MTSSSKSKIQQSPPFLWWQSIDKGINLNSPCLYAILEISHSWTYQYSHHDSHHDVSLWRWCQGLTFIFKFYIISLNDIVRYQHVKLRSKILISLHDAHISNVLASIASHHMVRYQYVKLRCKFFVWYLDTILTRHNANYSNHSINSYISWWCKHGINTHIYFSPFVINKKCGNCDTRRII